MEGIFTELKGGYNRGTMLTKLLYINVGVFVGVGLLAIILRLFNVQDYAFIRYISLSSDPKLLSSRPWTLFTYMLIHHDFFHILFNLLWLYGFGCLFLQVFTERQMGGLYLLGGLSGGILYILSYNIFPYFRGVAHSSSLMGASASILAIVMAVSFYLPYEEVGLLFIGRIKLIWIAIATLLIDLFSITSSNAGGSIAHLGGALVGYLFAIEMRKGKDITNWINHSLDILVNFFRRARTSNFSERRIESDYQYNARKQKESEEIDRILDKIRRSGYNSLTEEEKRKLFWASGKR